MKIEPFPDPWTPCSLNSRQDGPDWQSELFDNFKPDAVLQITERGCPVADVAARQGISMHSPCGWRKLYAKPAAVRDDEQAVQVHRTRDEARADGFDTIEMFRNPTRKHARNGMPSPVDFERRHEAQAEDVRKTWGD